MARTLEQWQTTMTDAVAASPVLAPILIGTSNTKHWRLWCYVFAFGAWTLDKLFDLFRSDVTTIVISKEPHTPAWYVRKAKEFQYGYNLVAEKDYYDNTGIPDDVVAASKIVAYAALVEQPFMRMKLAKKVGSGLGPLTSDERDAFVAYMLRIKDAGVKLKNSTITSTAPDQLKAGVRIKYNPLVLNPDGSRIDGTSATPVPDAMRNYLQYLNNAFNGLFSVQDFEAQVLAVDGVEDLKFDYIQTKYGALPFTSVDIAFVPDSGYSVLLDENLNITYEPA